MVAFLADIIVVYGRQIERFHATSHQVGDLGPLDLLGVIIACLVGQIDGVLQEISMQLDNTCNPL